MKVLLFSILLLFSSTVFAQNRLDFVKDENVKKEICKGIDFFEKSKIIPSEIKNKIVFISFYFEDLLKVENISIYYSTNTPMQFAKLNNSGQLETSSFNKILYFNYSSNVILVFENGSKYFNQKQMKQLSEQFPINKKNIVDYEYFKYEKGNEYTADTVENFISLDRINDKFTPVRVNTFDLKTFMEVWYGLDVKEIPVSQTKDKGTSKKDSKYKFHTHPE